MFGLRTATLVAAILLALPLVVLSAPFEPTVHNLERRVNANSNTSNQPNDPGIFPGGKESFKSQGWRVLPPLQGAKIDNTTFTVDDQGSAITTYIDENYDPQKIKRVVIQIHGQYRDAWNQWMYLNLSRSDAASSGGFSPDEVLAVAPMFFALVDVGAYPVDSRNVSNTKSLVWDNNGWGDIKDAIYPVYDKQGKLANPAYTAGPKKSKSSSNKNKRRIQGVSSKEAQQDGPKVSSLDILDTYLNYFSDTKRFPNVNKIVVSGFSMGAQTVNRYVALRTDTSLDKKLYYVMSSPASFMYVTDDRPENIPSNCTDFNDYKYGLKGTMPAYFQRHLDQNDVTTIRNRYLNRAQFYMVGVDDDAITDSSCEGMTQGGGHLNRMNNWVNKALPSIPGNPTPGKLPDTVFFGRIKYVSHDAFGIITSPLGQQFLFLQEFNGQGQNAKGRIVMEHSGDGGTFLPSDAPDQGSSNENNHRSSAVASSISRPSLMALAFTAVMVYIAHSSL
ncbi:Hypothetical protein, predicted to be GPI anchored [Malassezia sympodialis ATCC 42132]|uniref:Uncharacterized protein n=1 Tax=Malassezia sympodialis (strain ATCC 42132) TaxID=1230383 RepID=M5E6E9_MALS4|nr:Hypothetical protein, predicted to be GPI anchored [Malassezia sympodialis ATCC 42132]CCU97991.1 Hypothetical protein, predicted to be GPI anchored [Malassezia sympodialis ATCC 42132]SHO76428.1 Uncharacterized protein MSYG_0766 [Malassezia sympodialis ATCC 42132]|eukprot:XP_018739313.1 Hypothetical protein, predicted to be GPI anchored [Malassezia sympodialis ATCC 42132]